MSENTLKRPNVIPSLTVKDASAAIEFYTKVLGAQLQGEPMRGQNGGIMHAELRIGGMLMFVNDEFPEMGAFAPPHYQGSPVIINVYVPDVDKTYADALASGADGKMPPQDMFWGDRHGYFVDPFGHRWGILTPKEHLSEDEVRRRSEEFLRKSAKQG